MEEDDDKTVMIYPEAPVESHTEVNVFSAEAALPQTQAQYNVPFLETHQSHPFLSALRGLYRDVHDLDTEKEAVDTHTLQRKLIEKMDLYTRQFAEQGIENTHIRIVRYILSTFIDEMLGKKVWKDGNSWANHSLLSHYYHETFGGKRFFELLEQFMHEPSKYIQHMRLMYTCVSLGYLGKYARLENAEIQIESVRQELYTRIKNYHQDEEKFYKDHPTSRKKNKLTLHVPYKYFIIGTLLIMGIVYGIFTSMVAGNESHLIEILETNATNTHKIEKG